nr:TadE family protein [Arthrobacter zhaoguopingii]
MKRLCRERGAVAVETAMLLPLLLIILIGMVEFGRAYNVQIALTHAAREGARHAAIHLGQPTLDLTNTTLEASPSLEDLTVAVVPTGDCSDPDETVTIRTTVTLNSMTGLLEAQFLDLPALFPLDLEGIGQMRCGG